MAFFGEHGRVGAGEGAQAEVDDAGLQLVPLASRSWRLPLAASGTGLRRVMTALLRGAGGAAWARVCSKVGMKPVPPLPPTTSEAAAAPYRAAAGRLSPSTIRAVRVPTKASPAPVWSTTDGRRDCASTQESSQLVARPAGFPPPRRSRPRSPRRGRGAWRPPPSAWRSPAARDVSPGKDGVTRKACGASSASDRRRVLHGGEPGPEVGVEHEACATGRRP